eukprot:gnl/MRDRNA2_/MRDRNA2_113996_c0_seq1.p1 gnl/MRDRNA2_/MRDRNA2_113996_c0~~gnl/MRDRNA2_/MRDRNA2_113996_c0_seq1.p1  ORF type:complete len:296 (+),score=25.13 gnl/MRDRNA2_/MRDRNA2_113996_c0_seq1:57-944(+)
MHRVPSMQIVLFLCACFVSLQASTRSKDLRPNILSTARLSHNSFLHQPFVPTRSRISRRHTSRRQFLLGSQFYNIWQRHFASAICAAFFRQYVTQAIDDNHGDPTLNNGLWVLTKTNKTWQDAAIDWSTAAEEVLNMTRSGEVRSSTNISEWTAAIAEEAIEAAGVARLVSQEAGMVDLQSIMLKWATASAIWGGAANSITEEGWTATAASALAIASKATSAGWSELMWARGNMRILGVKPEEVAGAWARTALMWKALADHLRSRSNGTEENGGAPIELNGTKEVDGPPVDGWTR